MVGSVNSVDFSDPLRGSDDDVGDSHLASSVVHSVVRGEDLYKGAGEGVFAAHEDPFSGNKDIVIDYEGFAAQYGVPSVSRIYLAVKPPGVVGLPSQDEGDSFSVYGGCEGHGVVFVLLSHRPRGQGNDLVGVYGAGYVVLGPLDDDSFIPFFNHV